MMEGWDKLTPRQRQDDFLASWAAAEGIPFASEQTKADYQYRVNLAKDALQLAKAPDRVPNLPIVTFGPPQVAGLSGKQAMYDGHALGKSYLDFATTYQPDASGAPHLVMYGPALEALDYKLFKWPGHGVADHLSYQFVEKEYMKADEFDLLIKDPSDFILRTWMPRTCAALAPLAQTPPLIGNIQLAFFAPWLSALGAPPVQAALKALTEAGRLCFEWMNVLLPYMGQIMGAGFPFYAGSATEAPFDVLSDSLRGTTPLMLDVYRRPGKVLEALERVTPLMIEYGASGAHLNGNPLVFIPLHKGADGFMSDEQFSKFYWPSLNALMHGLAEQGCVPCCFVEGGYNQRLDYLLDTSDICSLYIFDRTDMAEARRVLGGKVCIGGGFPVSQILTGTPATVRDEVKRLLDLAAGDGGYMLSIGCALDEGKDDTLKAYIQAGKELGKY